MNSKNRISIARPMWVLELIVLDIVQLKDESSIMLIVLLNYH